MHLLFLVFRQERSTYKCNKNRKYSKAKNIESIIKKNISDVHVLPSVIHVINSLQEILFQGEIPLPTNSGVIGITC